MTSDFVEQFGFSEEEFAEQEECIGSVTYFLADKLHGRFARHAINK